MKKSLLTELIVGLVFLGGFLAFTGIERTDFLSEKALAGSELYIHNVTCSEIYEMRTVEDATYLKKIVELSVTAIQFRPVISVDLILGAMPDAYYVFDTGAVKYTFEFFDVDKQLDIGYVHREDPLIAVAKSVISDTAQDSDEWAWFCRLSAANYAELYEMIQTYAEGAIVK